MVLGGHGVWGWHRGGIWGSVGVGGGVVRGRVGVGGGPHLPSNLCLRKSKSAFCIMSVTCGERSRWQHRGGGGSHVAPHCHPICYGLRRGGDGPSLNLPPSPITSYPFREGPTNTTGRMEGTTS